MSAPSHWTESARALVVDADAAGLHELFQQHRQSGLDTLAFAFELFSGAVMKGFGAAVSAIAKAYPQECPLSVVTEAARGWVDALAFDLDGTSSALRRSAQKIALVQSGDFPSRDFVAVRIALSAALFEPSDWGPGRISRDFPIVPLAEGALNGGFVCVAGADSRYFKSYGKQFLEGVESNLAGEASAVLLLIDGDDEAVALARTWSEAHPDAAIYSVSYGGARLVEFAASARFIVANAILDRMARPVVFLDVDSAWEPGCEEVLYAAADLPLSCQKLVAVPPQLIIDACVLGAHPGAESTLFFQTASDYLRAKIEEDGPLWTLDQVALHRAVSVCQTNGIKIYDLCKLFEGRFTLPAYFKRKEEAIGLGDRQAVRTNHRYDLTQFSISDVDGRPIFAPVNPH